MSTLHADLAGLQLHDAYHYVQSSDPGAVGAGKNWLDTTSSPFLIKRRNSGDSGWDAVGGGGGAAAFTDLTDVPASYSGQALKIVRVNAGETDLEFSTPGSGSGPNIGDPDTPPVSANAMDDEFDDTTGMSGSVNGLDARWAWRNQGGATATFPDVGWIKLDFNGATVANWRLIEQALPGGDCTFVAKFGVAAPLSGDWRAGIIMVDGTNNDLYALGFRYSGGEVIFAFKETLTAFTASLLAFGVTFEMSFYLKVQFVAAGPTINFSVSRDGVNFIPLVSIADTVGPTKVGLGINDVSGVGLVANIDWFRRTA